MSFKTVEDFNKQRYDGTFVLRNDGDFADVIFLYRSEKDVLVADTHYIKSDEYSGYVHCTGRGCPVCAKGIRIQTKLFIPLYNIKENQIQFFDRTMKFEPQLQQDVFSKYPNPSEYVFRITRRGASGDINTRYEIQAVARNEFKSYDEILQSFDTSFPAHFEHICKDVDATTLSRWVSTPSNSSVPSYGADMPSYTVKPRVSSNMNMEAPNEIPNMVKPSLDVSGEDIDSEDLAEDIADEDVPF